MSLFIDRKPRNGKEQTPEVSGGIVLPNQVTEVHEDREVSNFLQRSNLDQVICSLIHQLFNVGHLPSGHDISVVPARYPKLFEHLETILHSYFNEPAGKDQLKAYLSHFSANTNHPVLVALTTIYKPFTPDQPGQSASESVEAELVQFEQILFQRADTDFRGIHLPSLRKIS